MNKQLLLLLVTALGSLFSAVHPLSAQTWTPTSAPSNSWASVAGSADGSKLVAAAHGGGIYTSTNSGATWTLTSAATTSWTCVASSADGTKLAAVSAATRGNVSLSTNSGATWENRSGGMVFPALPMFEAPYGFAVCLSADGTKLVVVENIYSWWSDNFVYGLIYTSTDSGATWNTGYESGSSDYWASVACSADGSKLVAAANGGGIYTSTDSGATWALTSAANASWTCVASSADGTKLAAVSAGSPTGRGYPQVNLSTNSGATWSTRNVVWALPVGFFGHWSAVASSADGTRLVVAANFFIVLPGSDPSPGSIYTSTDSGATWNSGPSGDWSSVASSADGNRLVAAANGGGIYISQRTPIQCLSIAPLNNNLVLSWLVPSTNFVLQQNLDLSTTNWTDVINLPGLQGQITLPMAAPSGFYRLKTL